MGHPGTHDHKQTGDIGSRSPTGATFTRALDGNDLVSTDDKGLCAPATHGALNAGTGVYRQILIEKQRK